MNFSNFIYRQKQRWQYHISADPFERQVAEINRNYRVIELKQSTFKIKGSKLNFNRSKHAFIVSRFELFQALLNSEGTFQIQDDDLLFLIKGLTLRLTTEEEIFIVHEIFIEGCYRVFNQKEFNVIDVGMNVGFASLFFASNSSVRRVFSFEPFIPTYNDAKVNFSFNAGISAKIIPYNYGLAQRAKRISTTYSADLKGKNTILSVSSNGEEIELKDATEVFNQLIGENAGDLFLVKMDCEGAEFEIFESLMQQAIPEVIFGFIIEWHQRNPQPIIEVLLANEFKVHQSGYAKIGLITAFR